MRLRVGGWYVLLVTVLKSGYCSRLRERPLLKGKPGLFFLVGFCHEYLETQPGTESMNCWLVKLFRVLDWCNFKQLRDFKNPFFPPSHTEKGWMAIEYNICLHEKKIYIFLKYIGDHDRARCACAVVNTLSCCIPQTAVQIHHPSIQKYHYL